MSTIKFNDEKLIAEFYEQIGSRWFKLQSETMQAFGEKQLDIYFKSLSLVIQVIGIVGVIAGFGFTAFDHIQCKSLFILGEAILLGTIIYALIWIQKIYKSEFDGLGKTTNKLKQLFTERMEKFTKIWNDISQKREADNEELLELQGFGDKMIEAFTSKEQDTKTKLYPDNLYILLVFGSGLLLLSFVFQDVISLICKL